MSSGGLLRMYSRSFEARPYLTLMVTNGFLMGCGDLAAQCLAHSYDGTLAFDAVRTLRFTGYGALFGPANGRWYHFLEGKFPLRPTNNGPIELVKVKVVPTTNGGEKGSTSPKFDSASRPLTGGAMNGGGGGSSQVSVSALAKRVAADQLFMAPIALLIFLSTMSFLEGLSLPSTLLKIKTNYFPILLVSYQVWPIWQLMVFRYVPLRYRVPLGAMAGCFWSCWLSTKVAKPVLA